MYAINCTTEKDFEVTTNWEAWIKEQGYEPCDSATVGVFCENTTLLSFKIDVFFNKKAGEWAIYYPGNPDDGEPFALIGIHNPTYTALLLELGISKVREAAYRAMAEAKANENVE